ncbi:MAG: hypothetical protein LUF87_02645 [Alistipes sp.]|nr:hypothetical protein [Alistipes sp.]
MTKRRACNSELVEPGGISCPGKAGNNTRCTIDTERSCGREITRANV